MVKRANRLIHDNDPTFEALGSSATANAELLEILSLEVDVLAPWMSLDRSRIRIPVYVPEQAYTKDLEVIATVSEIAKNSFPPDWVVTRSGEISEG